MRFPAIGTAAQLPHDGETLLLLARGGKIVGEFQEAFEEPRLAVEAVVGHHRFGRAPCRRAARARPRPIRQGTSGATAWGLLYSQPCKCISRLDERQGRTMLRTLRRAAQLSFRCAGGRRIFRSWTYSNCTILMPRHDFRIHPLGLVGLGAADRVRNSFQRRECGRARHVPPRRLSVLRHMGSRNRPDLPQDRFRPPRAAAHCRSRPRRRSRRSCTRSPILYTPTFVLVANGEEVGRIEGYPGDAFFWGLLDRLLDKLPPESPNGASVTLAEPPPAGRAERAL